MTTLPSIRFDVCRPSRVCCRSAVFSAVIDGRRALVVANIGPRVRPLADAGGTVVPRSTLQEALPGSRDDTPSRVGSAGSGRRWTIAEWLPR